MEQRYNKKSRKDLNIFTNLLRKKLHKELANPDFRPSKSQILFSTTGVPREGRLVPTFVRDIGNFLGNPGIVTNIDDYRDDLYIIEDGDRKLYRLEELFFFDHFRDADTGTEYSDLGILYFKHKDDNEHEDNWEKLNILAVIAPDGTILHYYKLDELNEGMAVDAELIQKAFRDKWEVFVIKNTTARGKSKKSKRSKRSKKSKRCKKSKRSTSKR